MTRVWQGVLLGIMACFLWSREAIAVEGAGRDQMQGSRNAEIVLGGGCFWCIEAVFQLFRGVRKVESGYAGGVVDQPSYEAVSSGETEHAEVVRIEFDTELISLRQILTIFFHAHDPTTMNRQGADVGTQYRSIILYGSEEQRIAAEAVKGEIVAARLWGEAKIVTAIEPLKRFFVAEEYHQDYFQRNRRNRYCAIVIAPKLEKIREEFSQLLVDRE